MTNRNLVNLLIVLTIVTVLGFGVNAFAGWGMGYGHGWSHGRGWDDDRGWGRGREMGYGRGWCDGSGMGYGRGMGRGFGRFGYDRDLNYEDLKKLDEERTAFFKATEGLRNDIFEKRLELRSELAKQNPDTQKAVKLQKEISELETQFDQKQIDHMVNMKKINPNIGRGFGGPYWR